MSKLTNNGTCRLYSYRLPILQSPLESLLEMLPKQLIMQMAIEPQFAMPSFAQIPWCHVIFENYIWKVAQNNKTAIYRYPTLVIIPVEAVLTVSQQLPRRFEQLLRNERSQGERTEEAGGSRKGKIWHDQDGDDIPAKKQPPLISHQGTDGQTTRLSVFWHERIWKRAREEWQSEWTICWSVERTKDLNCVRELMSSPNANCARV